MIFRISRWDSGTESESLQVKPMKAYIAQEDKVASPG
jgi:hypothetical protein